MKAYGQKPTHLETCKGRTRRVCSTCRTRRVNRAAARRAGKIEANNAE